MRPLRSSNRGEGRLSWRLSQTRQRAFQSRRKTTTEFQLGVVGVTKRSLFIANRIYPTENTSGFSSSNCLSVPCDAEGEDDRLKPSRSLI